MSEAEAAFWHKQFKLKNIPQETSKYEDFEKCQKIIQRDGKLSSRRYNELLILARKYCKI
ncbi:MAG: hypothetical protein A3K22_02135 [Deltaproteobacteria bacterium RBG_16_42_7]|nr:MAG: hypothetical protein A3K22_02135 [Deltaproteobacteria bacterium RBG_16_42_7]